MKISCGDHPKPENNSDCRTLAPYVMTLFDGEADEFQAGRARAHLLVCQTCARRWLDWNRSRDLLQSAPVPAPPPQLLWRLLLACRLSDAPRTAQVKNQTPSDLNAQILARTTRAASAAPLAPTLMQNAAPRRVLSPLGSLLRSPLQLSALATPALALWLMVLQRETYFPAPVFVAPAVSAAPAPRRARTPRATVASAPSRESKPARTVRSAALTEAPAAIQIAPSLPASAPFSPAPRYPHHEAAPVAATSALASLDETSFLRVPPETSPSKFDTPMRPDREQEEEIAEAASWTGGEPAQSGSDQAVSSRRIALSRVPSRHASPGRAALSLAALSGPSSAPRLRTAHWRAPLPAMSQGSVTNEAQLMMGAPQQLRVSLPNAQAPLAAREPALLVAEIESDDQHIEEIRSVVDEFRATLDPEDSSGADALSDEENTE